MIKKASSKQNRIQPDWWLKCFAGTVLGFAFSLALSGIFAWLGPDGISASNKVQFNMWIIAPIWMLMLSFVFLFKTGWRAIIWYTIASLVAYVILFTARGVGPS